MFLNVCMIKNVSVQEEVSALPASSSACKWLAYGMTTVAFRGELDVINWNRAQIGEQTLVISN